MRTMSEYEQTPDVSEEAKNAATSSMTARELPRGNYEADFHQTLETWMREALCVLHRRFRCLVHQVREEQASSLILSRHRMSHLGLPDRLRMANQAGSKRMKDLQEERRHIEEEIVRTAREGHQALDSWLAQRN